MTDRPDYSEWRARRRFHFALAGAFTFWLSPFVSWWLAFRQVRRKPGEWARILFGLAIVDTIVFGCSLVFFLNLPATRAHHAASHRASQPRIGVRLDAATPSGIAILGVARGSPAARAGLRAGDVLERLDGKPIRSDERLARNIGRTAHGKARRLRVRRGRAEFDVSVVPALGVKTPPLPARSLFAPLTTRAPRWRFHEVVRNVTGLLATLVLLLLVAVVARRRRVRLRSLGHVAMALVGATGAGAVVLTGVMETAGLSLGALLISLITGEVALLVAAATAMRRLDPACVAAAQPAAVPLGSVGAFGRGIFYTLTGGLRAAICVGALATLAPVGSNPVSKLVPVARAYGASALALLVLAVVIVGPIAEESLFRGVLLPWLARWMKPELAIFLSAVIFAAGHLFYGPGVLIIFVYGVVLAWMRLRTGRLRSGMALHMLINAVVMAVALGKLR